MSMLASWLMALVELRLLVLSPCLDHPGRLAMHEQEVVHPPVRLLQGELANRDPWARAEVQPILTLNRPPGGRELPVDLFPGPRLAREVIMVTRHHK
jgi:hypothetical protein